MHELRELGRELCSSRRALIPVVLGLVWGTVGLSVLMAFGEGFAVAMGASLARSGDAMLRFSSGATTQPFAGLPAGRRLQLDDSHLAHVASAPGVIAVSPEYQLSSVVASAHRVRGTNATTCGVGSDYTFVRGFDVHAGGRFLSARDVEDRRRVVVLGDALAAQLFPHGDAVGQRVRLWDAPFLVVGVMVRRPLLMNYGGEDQWKAFTPWTVARSMRGVRAVSYLLARVDDKREARRVETAVREVLAAKLRFDPADRPAVRCANHAVNAEQISGIITGTRVFLFLVGVLGLLVAALGVANMMFAMVEERVREIGLRLALGALPAQIRRRQLVESALVVAIGGGLGLLVAAVLLCVIDRLPMPEDAKGYLGHPLLSVATGLGIAGLLGIAAGIAGWHPAARAASVQPVEALRHE